MPKKPDAQQLVRFLETARALGCDEDEAVFDEKLRGISGKKDKNNAKPDSESN